MRSPLNLILLSFDESCSPRVLVFYFHATFVSLSRPSSPENRTDSRGPFLSFFSISIGYESVQQRDQYWLRWTILWIFEIELENSIHPFSLQKERQMMVWLKPMFMFEMLDWSEIFFKSRKKCWITPAQEVVQKHHHHHTIDSPCVSGMNESCVCIHVFRDG